MLAPLSMAIGCQSERETDVKCYDLFFGFGFGSDFGLDLTGLEKS